MVSINMVSVSWEILKQPNSIGRHNFVQRCSIFLFIFIHFMKRFVQFSQYHTSDYFACIDRLFFNLIIFRVTDFLFSKQNYQQFNRDMIEADQCIHLVGDCVRFQMTFGRRIAMSGNFLTPETTLFDMKISKSILIYSTDYEVVKVFI